MPSRLTCRVVVRGTLPTDWADWFTGLVATPTAGGDTALVGAVPDRTALHAVLTRVRDLGLELVSLSTDLAQDTTANPAAGSVPDAPGRRTAPVPAPAPAHLPRGRRALLVAGVTGLSAVGLYVGATVLGGLLDPEYSHVVDPISILTAAGADDRTLLGSLFIVYNLLLVGFAVAIDRASEPSRLIRVATVLFAVGAVAGIGQVTVFPQDAPGTDMSAAGATHIALAAVSSLVTITCAVLYGLAFRRDARWRSMSRPTFVYAALIVLSAPAAALSVQTSLMGLFERVTIGTFMVWVVHLSVVALRAARRERLRPTTS